MYNIIMPMSSNFLKFIQIMVFYIFISYALFPAVGYYMFGKTLHSAGTGFVVGSVISVFLWYVYGRKLINNSS